MASKDFKSTRSRRQEEDNPWNPRMQAIIDFAQSDRGLDLLDDIETFGLKGVDGAGDLTLAQKAFLDHARAERRRRYNDAMENN